MQNNKQKVIDSDYVMNGQITINANVYCYRLSLMTQFVKEAIVITVLMVTINSNHRKKQNQLVMIFPSLRTIDQESSMPIEYVP